MNHERNTVILTLRCLKFAAMWMQKSISGKWEMIAVLHELHCFLIGISGAPARSRKCQIGIYEAGSDFSPL